MCREFPGLDRSGLCANETTEEGVFRPYCSLEFFDSGPLLGGEYFHDFAPQIITFIKLWRSITRLILDVERSFDHQNDRNDVENASMSMEMS